MGNGSVLKAEQILELGSAVLQQLPVEGMTQEEYEYWTTHKRELGTVLRGALIRQRSPEITKVSSKIIFDGSIGSLKDLGRSEFWLEMWKHLGWEFNPAGLLVPAEQRGFGWLIGMPQGMTDNQSFDLNAKSFNCWRWTDDLDAAIVHNDRDPRNGAYFIRVRNRIEADKELKNLSAKILWERNFAGITHAERQVLEQAVWLVSGKHLDVDTITLCHGSRGSVGDVPCVDWRSGSDRLHVYWGNPGNADDYLRGRVAVS